VSDNLPDAGPLGESDEMPGAVAEIEANPMPVDWVKLAATLEGIVCAELEPRICVEIDEVLEHSTETGERDEVWLRGPDVELDKAILDEGEMDVPVASKPDADEDEEVVV
jgi:hypothetical protein